jgi:uncharacterized protein (TIRG00374 family)
MRYLRFFLTIILIIVAFFIISSKFKGVYYDIPGLLKEANRSILFLLVLFQAINYLGDSWLSQILLAIAGFKVKFRDALKVAIFGVVGNHVAPFIGGAIVTFYSYKKLRIPAAVISFLVFSWTLFIWLNYILFFLLSLFLLPSLVFNFISFEIILYIVTGIILVFVIFYLLFRKRGKYFIQFLNFFSKPINKIISFFNKKFSFKPKLFENFISEFHKSFTLLLKNKGKIPQILFFSFLFYIGDILTLYFSFLVFGFHPNLILLTFGYTISLVLTVFTLMPGAPGVMEASLMMVFIKLGFPAHIVLFSSLLFRIFSYWLPLPFGIVSWWRLKKASGKEDN